MIGIFLATGLLLSQGLFARTYGWPSEGRAYGILHGSDGTYAVAGFLWVSREYEFDFLLLKLSPSGELQWAKTIGGAYCDYAYSIDQTSDGGYVVGGWGQSYSFPYDDFFLVKVSSGGDFQWARTFGGQYHDFGWSVIQTSDEGFAFVGETEISGSGYSDALILKLSSSGELQWAKTWGGAKSDRAYSVIQTPDGGFVVAGNTLSFGAGGVDALVLKLSSSGELQWAKTFGGSSEETARCIIPTSDGGFAVAGWTFSAGAGRCDVLVLKLAADGNLQWARTFGGVDDERGFSIVETSDGGYAVAGHTTSFGVGSYDFLILKLTSDGVLQWASTFGTSGEDHLTSIIQNPDTTYTMAGTLSSGDNFDPMVLMLNANGQYPGCVQTYPFVQGTPTLNTTSPPAGVVVCSPNFISSTPSIAAAEPGVVDQCSPMDVSEFDPDGYGVSCVSIPGGLLFISQGEADIRIYLPDGRLACSEKLRRGRNEIRLDGGVYFWMSGQYRGKGVIQ